MKANNILCEKSLKVEIYVVGYKYQGESILCLITCDDVCIFSILIDSYRNNNSFIMDDIIRNKCISCLDLICWSHPHDDHSKGLKELIDKYNSNETEIFIPNRSSSYLDDCSDESKELFNTLLKKAQKNEGRIQLISDNKDMLYYHNMNSILYNSEKYEIEVKSLAPSSNQIIKNMMFDKVNRNEESIVFYLRIGGYNFVFTGDADNDEINLIPKKAIPSNISFLKIPHHCSNTSSNLLNIIGINNSVACTTAYRIGRSDLPELDLLDKYKSRFQIVNNSCANDDKCEYGITHIVYDILNGEISNNNFGLAAIHI